MNLRNAKVFFRIACLLLPMLALSPALARAQGPSPETAAPLFPGGALISYNSIFNTREAFPRLPKHLRHGKPTFSHEGDFNFTWGFFRDFDLTVLVPVVTNHFDIPGAQARPAARD